MKQTREDLDNLYLSRHRRSQGLAQSMAQRCYASLHVCHRRRWKVALEIGQRSTRAECPKFPGVWNHSTVHGHTPCLHVRKFGRIDSPTEPQRPGICGRWDGKSSLIVRHLSGRQVARRASWISLGNFLSTQSITRKTTSSSTRLKPSMVCVIDESRMSRQDRLYACFVGPSSHKPGRFGPEVLRKTWYSLLSYPP